MEKVYNWIAFHRDPYRHSSLKLQLKARKRCNWNELCTKHYHEIHQVCHFTASVIPMTWISNSKLTSPDALQQPRPSSIIFLITRWCTARQSIQETIGCNLSEQWCYSNYFNCDFGVLTASVARQQISEEENIFRCRTHEYIFKRRRDPFFNSFKITGSSFGGNKLRLRATVDDDASSPRVSHAAKI